MAIRILTVEGNMVIFRRDGTNPEELRRLKKISAEDLSYSPAYDQYRLENAGRYVELLPVLEAALRDGQAQLKLF